MGELFDKEVNAQKESLKKLQGVHASSPRKPTKKCAMKMKETNKQRNKEIRKKNDVRVKMLLMGGSTI